MKNLWLLGGLLVVLISCSETEKVSDLGKKDPQYSVLFKQMETMEEVLTSWGLEKPQGEWTVTKAPGMGILMRAWDKNLKPFQWAGTSGVLEAFMNPNPQDQAQELGRLLGQDYLVFTQNTALKAPWKPSPREIPRDLVDQMLLDKAQWYYHQRLYPLAAPLGNPEVREELLAHLVNLALEAYAQKVLGENSREILTHRAHQKALQTIASLARDTLKAYQDLLRTGSDPKETWALRSQMFQRDFLDQYQRRFQTPLYRSYGEKPPQLVEILGWSRFYPQWPRPHDWTVENAPRVLAKVRALDPQATWDQISPEAKGKTP